MSTKKILIVDDSNIVRKQIDFTLSKYGYETIQATNAIEALETLKNQEDIKLIISDVNMPEMSGVEMAEKLHGQGNQIPLIMLTTEGAADFIQRAMDSGAKGWLIKPFQADQLIATAKKIIGNPQD